MDDIDVDVDVDAAAMAEAMGFSSFGAQQPNKRRKYNPSADAFLDSGITANPGGGPMSSGSNSTPLGTRAPNKDEIDLDLDGDDEEGGSGTAIGAAVAQDTVDEDDPEPQYLDTSRPSAPAGAEPGGGLQDKIDSIVGAYHGGQPQLPTRPVFSPGTGGGRGGRGGHQSTRGSNRDPGKNWWDDYYDPSSNVNPWERLEQDRGMKPRGVWMSWDEAKR
ncbi:hypothetical protein SLS62_005381 [Diatrype stigma]|uniref:Uncharacterized protein n=1 Tax=Diatrype stigma TaxID=117547 RepID=A0AAN9YS64_9PEZI